MGLAADRAVGHRAGGEPLHDRGDRLDLVDRDRLPLAVLEPEQAAQRHQPLGLLVHAGGVLLEDVVPTGAGGVLQPEHRLGVEQVRLALAAPLVLAADVERAVRRRQAVDGVRLAVPAGDLLGHGVDVDAAELAGGAGEVAVDQRLRQAERLEDLRTGVRRDGGDAHLAHHLEHALAQRALQVLHGLLGLGVDEVAVPGQVLDGLHREVGVDRRGAVPDEQRDVVHLADVAGLDDQPDVRAGLLADQVVVHGTGEQQRRDRRELGGGVPVGEHDDAGAVGDRLGHLRADLVEPVGQRPAAALDGVEATGDVGGVAGQVAVAVDVPDLGQLVVGDRPGTAAPAGGRTGGSARGGCPPARSSPPAR